LSPHCYVNVKTQFALEGFCFIVFPLLTVFGFVLFFDTMIAST
jgi:hypothetical protein